MFSFGLTQIERFPEKNEHLNLGDPDIEIFVLDTARTVSAQSRQNIIHLN